jgi:hypothetical protein
MTVGAAGQCDRPLPGRRADLQALCLPGPALGTDEDRIHRCDGRRRLGDPRRCARPRSDADHAARQRSGQRGMDFRQDPLHLGRFAHAAPRPALCARERPLQPASWGEAFAAIKAAGHGKSGAKIGAIAGDLAGVEEMYALKGLMAIRSARPISIAVRTARRSIRRSAGQATSSIRPSRASRTPMRS